MQRATYRNILQQALTLAGSEPALAARLRAPLPRLQLWLQGAMPIPEIAFLDAVDLVLSAPRTEHGKARDELAGYRSTGPHGPSLD